MLEKTSCGNRLNGCTGWSPVFRENRKITEIFCHNLRCWLDGRVGDMRNVLDKTMMY